MKIDLSYCPREERVDIISPDGEHYITDEELVFNYIRGQISRWKLKGWKVRFGQEIYNFDEDGQIIEGWPVGLFEENDKLNAYVLKYGLFRDTAHTGKDKELIESLIQKDVEKEELPF